MEQSAGMELTDEMQVQMTMRISPRLIAANHILELSAIELQQFVQQEIEENPALELTESINCPTCGEVMVDGVCYTCTNVQGGTKPEPGTFDQSEAYMDEGTWQSPAARDPADEFDVLSVIAAPMTLSERLLSDLAPLLKDDDQRRIAEYLVGNLDDNGYLRCSTAEIARTLGLPHEQVKEVLGYLQSLEPVGVGARNLQECLLIQLAHLENQGHGLPLARAIVANYFDELGTHKYSKIAQALNVDLGRVMEAAHEIRDKLTPFPAQHDGNRARSAPTETPRYILPDIAIRQGDNGLEVEVVESRRFVLRLNRTYHEMWRAVESKAMDLSLQDRRHIRRYITRAKLFMANLEQRRRTMQKIGDFLAEFQEDYLLYGVRHLKPLTRAMVAAYTGMHESTVSRATAGKWVMIPSGKVIPCSDFFASALNVKDVIRELVATETEPLTDQHIAELLSEQGYHIARRSVAKYRDQLGILPSALRN